MDEAGEKTGELPAGAFAGELEVPKADLIRPSGGNCQAANRRKRGSWGGRPVSHDVGLHKERNTVERLINKLKAWRGIATR
ncbi:hypothetical protein GCM10010211_71200 [Streptomyces albospinus]|uniref:Transposase n=1 Tax=Streptomyces albospinus TaxID=285515 RepID=A0ABQ2VL80_9ACTN|nr:hypothetical protein GCM10010211_71200 [Streptomyces albospinus]